MLFCLVKLINFPTADEWSEMHLAEVGTQHWPDSDSDVFRGSKMLPSTEQLKQN